jgi:hypothetical protein
MSSTIVQHWADVYYYCIRVIMIMYFVPLVDVCFGQQLNSPSFELDIDLLAMNPLRSHTLHNQCNPNLNRMQFMEISQWQLGSIVTTLI